MRKKLKVSRKISRNVLIKKVLETHCYNIEESYLYSQKLTREEIIKYNFSNDASTKLGEMFQKNNNLYSKRNTIFHLTPASDCK